MSTRRCGSVYSLQSMASPGIEASTESFNSVLFFLLSKNDLLIRSIINSNLDFFLSLLDLLIL